MFVHGQLEDCQRKAFWGYEQFRTTSLPWASKFRLLEAQAMLYRGLYPDSLAVLSNFSPPTGDLDESVQELTTEAVSLAHLHRISLAAQKLSAADAFCTANSLEACGEVLRAHGILAMERGQLSDARQAFLSSLSFARAHHDLNLESNARLNLGTVALQDNHYDEAVDWSQQAYASSLALGNQNRAQIALGNLGWAYFELGDSERALPLFREAEQRAAKLGNIRNQVKWLTTTGYVYQNTGDWMRAAQFYGQVLDLARPIHSQEDVINSLEDLAHLSIAMGNLDQANAYLAQLTPLVRATQNRLDDLDITLAQGEIAAARRQDQQAQSIFKSIAADPDSQTSMRLGAEHQLASLYEREGNAASADRMYRTALTTFESARQQLKKEDSKLPFLANATPIYTDYIHFLIQQGKVRQALDVADHGRARTLEQGLGLISRERTFHPAPLNPGGIARKAGATLLFYWLGRSQSYLWAITPTKTALFPLPARSQIAAVVQRYRNVLLGPDGTLESSQADGVALYRTLVAPAAALIPPGANVVILSDGALSELNFETLIVPGPHPHYWIEDATLSSAPSLYMLAAAKPARDAGRRLLLLGNAVSPNPDYPQLAQAPLEMQRIEKHFPANDETVLSRQQANPASYLNSRLGQYSYIHFVAHGVASRTDPLDSAIILSPASDAEDSFKLYAREIIQHPIHAQLVTISSCYGGGTRSYAGEGLVGLSWAFLRAGAHNVIGALWEVSDDSTPQLMDTLYQRLEQGAPPAVALRQAKLTLLHSQGSFRNPFYWAPFQLYTGL